MVEVTQTKVPQNSKHWRKKEQTIDENQAKHRRKSNKPSTNGKTTCRMVSPLRSRNGRIQIDYKLHGNEKHRRSEHPNTNPLIKCLTQFR